MRRLGLAYIPPELREDRGEIEAALAERKLPDLIQLKDMKGDLQMHTTWSDGATDVMDMARAAMALGYEYILITDHTAEPGRGQWPDAGARARSSGKEIDKVNARTQEGRPKFRVLHGVEVEVKTDGAWTCRTTCWPARPGAGVGAHVADAAAREDHRARDSRHAATRTSTFWATRRAG